MGLGVQLAAEGPLDLAVAPHDVADPPGEAHEGPAHAVGAEHLAVRIAHERVGQIQGRAKALARLGVVGRDTDDLEAGLAEGLVLAAEPAGLARSAGRERLREEEEDRALLLEDPVERAVTDSEVRGRVPDSEHLALGALLRHDRPYGRRRQGLECPAGPGSS